MRNLLEQGHICCHLNFIGVKIPAIFCTHRGSDYRIDQACNMAMKERGTNSCLSSDLKMSGPLTIKAVDEATKDAIAMSKKMTMVVPDF